MDILSAKDSRNGFFFFLTFPKLPRDAQKAAQCFFMDLENTVLLFFPGSQKASHLELLSLKPCKGGELVIHNSAQCDLDS